MHLLAMDSPDFSPPEMRLLERRVREFPGVHPFVVDIWHLGVCIINLVLGFNPFQTYTDQFRSIINQMKAAQEATPADRYATTGALHHAMDWYARSTVHAILVKYGREADSPSADSAPTSS